MEKKRGFEVLSTYENKEIHLPTRATKKAAGYDFEASEEVVIPSIIKNFLSQKGVPKELKGIKPTLVPTGVKAYMGADEYLQLANRSSNPLKRFLLLGNGIGVIDADYYNNAANEGHIMFQFLNIGLSDVVIKKGERIGQGIFLPFLKADDDHAYEERKGGFGSSGK